MIDIHTHIIPFVDDGSSSLEDSLAMVKHEISIGVDTIICTPHHIFHRYEKSIEDIKKNFNLLKEEVEKQLNELREQFITREAADDEHKQLREENKKLQNEIDELIKAMETGEDDFTPIRTSRKIKIYDFKRPDKFSRLELRDISNVSEIYAKELRRFLSTEYDINASIHVASVDQLTCEEFIRSIPTPLPFCSFKWNDGAGILTVDPALFYKGFLNSQLKKNHEPNGLEQKIFLNCIYKPFEIILHETFSDEVGSTLPEISDVKYECNPQFTSSVIWSTEMGVVITFVVRIGKTEAYMNLFFNADCIESL